MGSPNSTGTPPPPKPSMQQQGCCSTCGMRCPCCYNWRARKRGGIGMLPNSGSWFLSIVGGPVGDHEFGWAAVVAACHLWCPIPPTTKV